MLPRTPPCLASKSSSSTVTGSSPGLGDPSVCGRLIGGTEPGSVAPLPGAWRGHRVMDRTANHPFPYIELTPVAQELPHSGPSSPPLRVRSHGSGRFELPPGRHPSPAAPPISLGPSPNWRAPTHGLILVPLPLLPVAPPLAQQKGLRLDRSRL